MTAMRRSVRRAGLVVLAALALVLPACAASDAPGVGSPPAGSVPGAALDFNGPTVDGSTLDVSGLAGTAVVLWFWAPWCTICRAEAPDLAAVTAEFQGRVRVLGVAGRGEVDAMKAFVSETGTGAITHLADVDGTLWNRFGVVSQPSFVFVDRSGVARSFTGSLDGDELRAAFAGLA